MLLPAYSQHSGQASINSWQFSFPFSSSPWTLLSNSHLILPALWSVQFADAAPCCDLCSCVTCCHLPANWDASVPFHMITQCSLLNVQLSEIPSFKAFSFLFSLQNLLLGFPSVQLADPITCFIVFSSQTAALNLFLITFQHFVQFQRWAFSSNQTY